MWRTVHEATVRPHGAQPALILGAGSAGTQLVANMLSDPNSPFMPVGLLDDDPAKRHLRIQGVRDAGQPDGPEAGEGGVRRRGPDHRDPLGPLRAVPRRLGVRRGRWG